MKTKFFGGGVYKKVQNHWPSDSPPAVLLEGVQKVGLGMGSFLVKALEGLCL